MNDTNTLSEKKTATLAGNTLALLADSRAALEERGLPADLFLKKVFRENRQFGSRDRHFISDAIFAYYRWFGWLERTFPGESEKKRMLAAFAADGTLPASAALWCRELGIDFEFYCSLFQTETPEKRFDAFAGTKTQCSFRDLIPAWMIPELADGAEEGFLPFLTRRPPVWIRVHKDEKKMLSEFADLDIKAERDSRMPSAMRLSERAKVSLYQLKSFCSGAFEVQDFASQVIGFSTGASEQERWWDACAGGGGKSLQLADMGADVAASDVRERKLEDLLLRVRRAGIRTIHTEPRAAAAKKTYDGVLADVPCSSSGRWRRNPEMRFIFTEKNLRELTELQFSILKDASASVRRGGLLSYGTCSVFRAENTGIAERFLRECPEFEPAPFRSPLDGRNTWFQQTFPGDADCDGTFCARFRKK